MMTLAQAHAMLPGSQLVGDGNISLSRVHTDTRSVCAGDLFVALKGERFDAHDFLAQAKLAGAAAAIAEHGLSAAGLPGLIVDDTRWALGDLAAAWRKHCGLRLIAVTGSNGKTTVTQMIATILRAWRGQAAHATQGNLNNEIGVPLTLLGLRAQGANRHECAVVELGMNHPGEIARLAAIAAPDVALINNAQREHQEFMVSVEAVARENGGVIQALGLQGVAVFPAGDAFSSLWRGLAGSRRVLQFGLAAEAEVRGRAEWRADHWQLQISSPAGDCALALHLPGAHNVHNALAAAASAIALDCPLPFVAQGLSNFRPVKGRSQILQLRGQAHPITLVDDSYNANPDSVRAAIDLLMTLPAPRWLILGDMGEVGDDGPAFHVEVGSYARARGIDALWTAGELCAHTAQAFGPAARHFANAAALVATLREAGEAASSFQSILVKGSRFMKMEQVVNALQDSAQARGGQDAA